MAEIILSPDARDLIRSLIASRAMVEPVLSVHWWKGTKDNFRNQKGEVEWRTIDPPRWDVHLLDFGKFGIGGVSPETFEIDGIRVRRDAAAQSGDGTLTIEARYDALSVVHRAGPG